MQRRSCGRAVWISRSSDSCGPVVKAAALFSLMLRTGIRTCILPGAVFFIALAAVVPAGALSEPAGPEGVEWLLLEAGGAPVEPVTGGQQPRFLLDAAQKKASGFTGCNSFFGGYELAGSKLVFGPLGMTRRACPDAETALEQRFLGVLGSTRGWSIRDAELLLLDDSGVIARFGLAAKDVDAPDPGSLTYRSTLFPSGTVTLSHGEYRGPAAPGSVSEIVVKISGKAVFGVIQGRQVGSVVLIAVTGGSGSFYELALLSRGEAGWQNTDTVLLGDRVKVHAVAVENGQIIVDMTIHGPHDPVCCPTLAVKKRFAVRDDRLVPAGEKAPEGRR